jgi:aspartate ammonia-lyase
MAEFRLEHDALGSLEVPENALYGIHSLRSARAFNFSDQKLFPEFISAISDVKLACAATNFKLGYLAPEKFKVIEQSCKEISGGRWHDQFIVDPYQGGAGTSTNMNANEVIANRSIQLSGGRAGDYNLIHPLHDVNMHQSTNDVFPTALTVASLRLLKTLEDSVAGLQEVFQKKEAELRDVIKSGRTELMDAVPMTMGMSFSTFAEAFSRDRWRIFKSRERIKRINLGGTVLGTGVGAPRDYILQAASILKNITGLPVSRAENMIDATQNMDRYVEVFGMLKTYAVNLYKISSDLRLMGSGPATGLGELNLPPVQAGSSIMAGKINPVMPEAVSQVALRIMGNDHIFSFSAASGQLDLNHLMPLLAQTLLESLRLLNRATTSFSSYCSGITADKDHCRAEAEKSRGLATLLVPYLGYANVEQLLHEAVEEGITFKQLLIRKKIADSSTLNKMLEPSSLCRMGFVNGDYTFKKSGSPDSPEQEIKCQTVHHGE